ncbi:MAG: hypothetical protein R3F48_00260 [Candidatus Zixiibacteriota bacterium]
MNNYGKALSRLGLLAVALFVFGCSDTDDPVSSPVVDTGNPQDTVTYTADIKAVLDSRCISCHSSSLTGLDRNGAPVGVNFNTYSAAVANASAANVRIQSGTMPPTGGLPQGERSLFQEWINDGLIE